MQAVVAGVVGLIVGVMAAVNLARIHVMRFVLGKRGPYPKTSESENR